MSKVRVQLFADLREFSGGEPFLDVEITAGDTIASVIDRLGIPSDRVKMVFLNARSVAFEQALTGGEKLSVFSHVGGG